MDVDQLVNKPLKHPYQCIASVTKPLQSGGDVYLLTACGPKLLSVSLRKGLIVSSWPNGESVNENIEQVVQNGEERPAKKQKTENVNAPLPSIIKLTISPDQQYAVAVTDDKYVRVFTVSAEGRLEELSQRCMPKRPCAIHVLPDNATIIVGDKFGDVYALPLLSSEESEAAAEAERKAAAEAAEKPAFKPSATNLTVHTKRNRMALEAQQNQKSFSARKEPLKFEHKLLLGHVSMLTDVIYTSRTVDGKVRGYLMTADRDEHIRVSRGPPQSHVIEGYCLGHTEFVSKLCVVDGADLLVSGGGDDELFIWKWPDFKLHRKYDLGAAIYTATGPAAKKVGKSAVEAAEQAKEAQPPSEHGGKEISLHKANVSGIWTTPLTNDKDGKETVILVASERVPALFAIPSSRLQLKQKTEITTFELEHPPLDVATVSDTVLVTLDARSDDAYPLIQAFRLKLEEGTKGSVVFDKDESVMEKLKCLSAAEPGSKFDDKSLDELLYGIANLRKRRDEDAPRVPHGDGEAEEQAMGVEGFSQQPKTRVDV